MDVRRRQPMGVELVKRGIVNEEAIEEAFNIPKRTSKPKNWRYIIYIRISRA